MKHPATWMGCLVKADPAFGTFPLSGIAVPGSLNAGAFNLDPQSFDTQRGSVCTTFSKSDSSAATELARWTQSQDETITEQLDQGIRFLNINVAYNGNGSPTTGWRAVNTQFSEWPLYDDLDQIANWAKTHPSEVVIVDFRNVCYDNGAKGRFADGLWSSFATSSDVGGGPTKLDQVTFDPAQLGGSLARASLDQVTAQTGHNVIVLLPQHVIDLHRLISKYQVHPLTALPGARATNSPDTVPLTDESAKVTPASPADVGGADARLASDPLHARPALGSLTGTALYETDLAYDFDPTMQATLFQNFGGLIHSPTEPLPRVTLPAWESTLLMPDPTGSIPRNAIVAKWGHKANVVLSDGVEYGNFIGTVIGANAKSHG